MPKTTEDELMAAIMQAAADLIQTYDAGFTENAIRTRMERIAEDLLIASEVKNHD